MFDFLGGNGNNDSMEFERFVNIVNQSYNFPMIDCGVHNHQDHRKDSSVRRLTSVARVLVDGIHWMRVESVRRECLDEQTTDTAVSCLKSPTER